MRSKHAIVTEPELQLKLKAIVGSTTRSMGPLIVIIKISRCY